MGIQPENDCFNDISGSNIVCSSNETFSVSVPSCCSVEWSKSSELNQVGGNTSSNYTVNSAISTYCMTGWVQATFKNSDGDVFLTKTKSFGVNGPKTEDMELALYTTGAVPVSYMCPETNYHIYLENDGVCSLTNLSWTIPAAWDLNYQSSNMISVYTNSIPGGMVEVEASTCCGDNVEVMTGYFSSGYCSSSLSLLVSPNPTNIETTITIESSNTEKEFVPDELWTLEVYNSSQILIQKEINLNGNQCKLNTSGWKEGIYYIRATYGNEILVGKFIVKK